MTLKEKIEVMQAFERGEEIEHTPVGTQVWQPNDIPRWDWHKFEYRIKPKPKQMVVIERWLCEYKGYYTVKSTSNIDAFLRDNIYVTKVALLSTDTYEVEL